MQFQASNIEKMKIYAAENQREKEKSMKNAAN